MRQTRRIRDLLAASSVAVGIIHAFAFRDHTHHPLIAAFFVFVAVGQIAWAFAVVLAPRRPVLLAGAVGNAAVVGAWVLSRTTGLPFVPGAAEVESVGRMDAIATGIEVAIIAGALFILTAGRATVPRLRPQQLATGAVAMGLALIALPGAIGTPIGSHAYSEGADGHAHETLAAGHDHAPDEAGHSGEDHPHASAAGHATHGPTEAHGHADATNAPHAHAAGATAASHAGHDKKTAPASKVAMPKPRGQRAVVRYGPFIIPPAQADGTPGVASPIETMLQPPCRGCYITATTPDLLFQDGSTANYNTGVMLHHVVIGDSSEPDVTCGRRGTGSFLGRRFFAAGNERTEAVLPSPYGYRVDAQDWWTGAFELMNFTKTSKSVFVEMAVHQLPVTDTNVKPVTPVWMDMNNCGDSQYSIPAGRRVDTWSWTSTITGRVVWAGGHVHNWGLSTTLSNIDAGQKQCKSVAGYGTDPAFMGNIESMSVCAWDRLGTVRKGERLQIASVYDSPQARSDVMGIMVAFVYETSDLQGGSQAPREMTDPADGPPPEEPSDEHQH